MPLLTCPDCGRQVSDMAPACPGCGRPAVPANYAMPTRASTPQPKRFPRWIMLMGVTVFVVPIVIGWLSSHSAKTTTERPPEAPTAAMAAPTEEPDPTKVALIKMDTMTAVGAFAFAKPNMVDVETNDSGGTALFALWGARRMRWADVYVTTDETTFATVQKDSSEQLGRRMCSAGVVAEIHADKPGTGGHIAHGQLISDSGHIYHFVAAGSSGDIGEESRANFCGFVTGNYDFSNSVGGTGHAVTVVGMFDLPENRAAGR
jgi:hypothetical protein